MNIVRSTQSYEAWLRKKIAVNEEDLAEKHKQMAASEFPFLRATFYRWLERLPKASPDFKEAPNVCAVGDLHVENFGTWRDAEGRLIWGINDFDEAYSLPYTNDLIRLATSIELARAESKLSITLETACSVLLEGYKKALLDGGAPFVLEEKHDWLRDTATGDLRHPVQFWKKIERGEQMAMTSLPQTALKTLKAALPKEATLLRVRHRQSGLGSLGRPRYVAIGAWEGGNVVREVKAFVPSAVCWAWGEKPSSPSGLENLLENSVRCTDPFARLEKGWIVRRLAPHCIRIELNEVPDERDEEQLFHAMGYETGNVHLASKKAMPHVLKHLKQFDADTLQKQASRMADEVRKDFHIWHENYKK